MMIDAHTRGEVNDMEAGPPKCEVMRCTRISDGFYELDDDHGVNLCDSHLDLAETVWMNYGWGRWGVFWYRDEGIYQGLDQGLPRWLILDLDLVDSEVAATLREIDAQEGPSAWKKGRR
jgi:hypothetical protein